MQKSDNKCHFCAKPATREFTIPRDDSVTQDVCTPCHKKLLMVWHKLFNKAAQIIK